MNPNLLRLLALLGQGSMVAGGIGMLVDKDKDAAPKSYGSYQEFLEDESVPLEDRMKQVEQIQRYRSENSPAHRDRNKAKLDALKKLQGK